MCKVLKNQHTKQDAKNIKVVIKLQSIVAIIAILIIMLNAPFAIKSTLYGSLVAIINTVFLYWRMQKAQTRTNETADASLKAVYRSAIERFILIGCLLAIGMVGVLKLSPVIVLISFIIGQLVFLLGVIIVRLDKNQIN